MLDPQEDRGGQDLTAEPRWASPAPGQRRRCGESEESESDLEEGPWQASAPGKTGVVKLVNITMF